MSRAIDHTQAVVLSGGGAYGAYEVGVMKALLTGESPSTSYEYLNPGIFTGTSVGAYNASFMVSRPDEDICATVRLLESIWLTKIAESSHSCGNGVFRVRGNPLGYLSPNCLTPNPARPIDELVNDGTFLARDFFNRSVNFLMSSGTVSDRVLDAIDASALLTAAPLRALVRTLVPLEHIRRADRVLRLMATNWETGELRVFGN